MTDELTPMPDRDPVRDDPEVKRLIALSADQRRIELDQAGAQAREVIIRRAKIIYAMRLAGDDLDDISPGALRSYLAIAMGDVRDEIVDVLESRKEGWLAPILTTLAPLNQAYIAKHKSVQVYERGEDGKPAVRHVPLDVLTRSQARRAFKKMPGGQHYDFAPPLEQINELNELHAIESSVPAVPAPWSVVGQGKSKKVRVHRAPQDLSKRDVRMMADELGLL